AEGKIIEEANERALSMGTTTDKVFELVKKIRAKVDVPLILLTYMNPIYVYGTLKFFEKCKECGVEGLIIPDLPYEEKHEVEIAKNKFDISVVTIIAPTSRDRIKMLAENAEGLIYLIPSTDSTGVREHINADLEGIVKEIRQASEVPIVIGLGISTPEQVKNLSKISDGIVTESDIVKIVRKHGENAKELIHDYVKDMKANLV
ncbi:MAG: tryptophan synthase subunit alpha, partial [Oscillospiraceae bacterium]